MASLKASAPFTGTVKISLNRTSEDKQIASVISGNLLIEIILLMEIDSVNRNEKKQHEGSMNLHPP